MLFAKLVLDQRKRSLSAVSVWRFSCVADYQGARDSAKSRYACAQSEAEQQNHDSLCGNLEMIVSHQVIVGHEKQSS